MEDTMIAREIAEQQYTLSAAIAFGWTSMELIVHLCDDCTLIRHWRWAHTVYFSCRYTGLLTSISFLVLACVGNKTNAASLCQGFYILEHITSSLVFVSSGAMFWIRAGFICDWKKILMIPLALYGLTISALAMKSDVNDYQKANFPGSTTDSTSLVCAINSSANREQAYLRFLMAIFDILTAVITFTYLYKKKTPQSWLTTILTRDQLIYVGATTLTYIALGIDLLLNAKTRVTYIGVVCPGVISIISCRLFLRLKRKGLEDHQISAMTLPMDLSSPSQSRSHPNKSDEEHALQELPWLPPSQSIVLKGSNPPQLQLTTSRLPNNSHISISKGIELEPPILPLSASMHPYASSIRKSKDANDTNALK